METQGEWLYLNNWVERTGDIKLLCDFTKKYTMSIFQLSATATARGGSSGAATA